MRVSLEPDRVIAGHRQADQPIVDRVDTLLWQVLRHEAERVHALCEHKGGQLGKTKIRKSAIEYDEGNAVAVPNICAKSRLICPLVATRL